MADTALQEFGKQIESELVPPLRRTLIGRKLVHVTAPQGFGVTSVEWGALNEMGDGMVSYGFTNTNVDTVNANLTANKIPVYWKDFEIDRRMYESYLNSGIEIDTAAAMSASFVAGKTEDTAIIDGVSRDGTNYDIDGLYQGAGSSYDTTKDFGTYGNATDAVSGAMAALDDADVPSDNGLNLVLPTTQRHELRASRSANGVREEPEIREMLNGGDIFMSKALTAGTGLVLPAADVGQPYLDYFLTQDWTTELGKSSEKPQTSNIYGRVYSAGILRIKHSEAIVKLTDI